jgi:hypothetical protein
LAAVECGSAQLNAVGPVAVLQICSTLIGERTVAGRRRQGPGCGLGERAQHGEPDPQAALPQGVGGEAAVLDARQLPGWFAFVPGGAENGADEVRSSGVTRK